MAANTLWLLSFTFFMLFVSIKCEKLSKRTKNYHELSSSEDTTRVKKVCYFLFIDYKLTSICTCLQLFILNLSAIIFESK